MCHIRNAFLEYSMVSCQPDNSGALPQKQSSISVLAVKRSNIITIALSSLPPPRLLPPAIYSMDSSVLDREDIQVQLTRPHPHPLYLTFKLVCATSCASSVCFFTFPATSSSDPDRGRASSDQRSKGPEPPLSPGPGWAVSADSGRNPSPEYKTSALDLCSGLRLLREGRWKFWWPVTNKSLWVISEGWETISLLLLLSSKA